MTKILCVGDIHIKPSNLSFVKLLTDRIILEISNSSPDFVVFLGDLSDSHEKIHTQCLNAIQSLLNKVSKACPTFALIGNHDIISPNLFLTKEHPFGTFDIEGRLQIIDKPIQAGAMLFVPYVPAGRFKEALSGIDMTPFKIVFAHQEFLGCKFNGQESSVGDHWDLPIQVVSGHIHEKQSVGMVYYTGTPYQTNFGESANKSIALVELNEMTGSIAIQEIYLGMPQKITEHLDITEARKFEIPENTDLRLTISGTHDQIAAFKKGTKAQELESKAKVVWKATDNAAPVPIKRDSKTFIELFWEYGNGEGNLVLKFMAEVLK